MKKGKITPNGVVLHTHENATVVFLTDQGFDIELLPPVQRKGARTPDIRMAGIDWEIKCPTGKSTHTIKRAFKVALGQSKNIIFDLRNSKMPDKVNIVRLEKEFTDIKSAKNLKVITKSHGVLDFRKR
ncbi:hypothetical protein EPO04_03770 [Patescibacteria group bacterium]|nr:MAG: hypothetical protein EPO04_03770 [Patescibacteria group bacterium]